MQLNELIQQEERRSQTYQTLSQCFRLPDEQLFEKLVDLEQNLTHLCPEAADYISAMPKQVDNLQALKVDYSQLFVGPFQLLAPPYGSVYLENNRLIMGGTTVAARQQYQEAGLTFSGEFKDVPDHIVLELEFMYYLIFQTISATAKGQEEAILLNLDRQQRFLQEHIGRWISAFADKVKQHAKSDFYKLLAQAAETFIRQDYHELRIDKANDHG